MTGSNTDLASVAAEAEARYVAANPESKRRHDAAVAHMPGGNTRTVLFYSPFPVVLKGGEGCRIRGCRRPRLHRLSRRIHGRSLRSFPPGAAGGPRTRWSMTASRSAATMSTRPNWRRRCAGAFRRSSACASAIPAPRATCSRSPRRGSQPAGPAIMVFHGAYHGGVFYFGQQKSPINAPFPWIIGHYNDIDSTLALINKHAPDLGRRADRADDGRAPAASPPTQEFLQAVRSACTRLGIAADLRRGDDLAPLVGRPAEEAGRHARSHQLRQVSRRRRQLRRLRRPAPTSWSASIPRRARCRRPCRHLQQQRVLHGRGPRRPDEALHRRSRGQPHRRRRRPARAASTAWRRSTSCRMQAHGRGFHHGPAFP